MEFKSEKRRIKYYVKRASNQFQIDKAEINKINGYSDLIRTINEKYLKIIDNKRENLFKEKIKTKEKIDRSGYADTTEIIINIITIAVAIFTVVLSRMPEEDLLLSAIMVLYVFIGILIIFGFLKISDKYSEKRAIAYNNICLSILEEIEHKFEDDMN